MKAEWLKRLDEIDAQHLPWEWWFWGRQSQQPPVGEWNTWLLLAGRGFGKTRTGAEWVKAEIETGRRKRIALVAPTAGDARDVMVEGESGILAISRPTFRPQYNPSLRRLTWPNGAIATTFSADEPDRLRGPQFDGAWADEVGVWKHPEAWDNLVLGVRLGMDPRKVVTTTPKPTRLVRDLLDDSTCSVTRGTTYENEANLAPPFLRKIVSRYEGTRTGRQEIYADVLDESEGALWKRGQIDALRVEAAPELERIVVAIDPAATSAEGSDETGIVVVGAVDGQGYVLADLSVRASPDAWARAAVGAYYAHKADRIVAEVNNGGEMVELVIRTIDPAVSYKAVRASRGKYVRAEPVAALYEQGKVHHVGGFSDLEDQMCMWEPGNPESPDRMDALVWALTDLLVVPSEMRLLGTPATAEEGRERPAWVW